MEKNTEYSIIHDRDLKGISIGIIESFIIEGEKVTKPIRRCAFRKVLIDDEGNETPNENYHAEIDAWTGEKDFIKNKVNF